MSSTFDGWIVSKAKFDIVLPGGQIKYFESVNESYIESDLGFCYVGEYHQCSF